MGIRKIESRHTVTVVKSHGKEIAISKSEISPDGTVLKAETDDATSHPSGLVGKQIQPALFMNVSAAIEDSPLRQASARSARRPGRRARRSVGQHTVSSMPPSLAAPRVCLAWRLRDFATNRHE
jgi:hypothetical protein